MTPGAPPTAVSEAQRDQWTQSFDQCGKSIHEFCVPLLRAIFDYIKLAYETFTLATSLISLLFRPWVPYLPRIPDIKQYLAFAFVVVLTVSYVSTNLVSGAGALVSKVGCSVGLQYISGSATFFGLADFCHQGPDSDLRPAPEDTISKYNWVRLNTKVAGAQDAFADFTNKQVKLLKLESLEGETPKIIAEDHDLFEAAGNLSKAYRKSHSELVLLRNNHDLTVDSMRKELVKFASNIHRNNEDLEQGRWDFWMRFLPGTYPHFIHMKGEVMRFASPDRRAELLSLISQVQRFTEHITETEEARVRISRQIKKSFVLWSTRCMKEETKGVWALWGLRAFKKQDSTELVCRENLKELQVILLLDKTRSRQSKDLEDFAHTARKCYDELLNQYACIERSLKDLHLTAKLSTFTDSAGYMFLFTEMHNQIVKATELLAKAMKAGAGKR